MLNAEFVGCSGGLVGNDSESVPKVAVTVQQPGESKLNVDGKNPSGA